MIKYLFIGLILLDYLWKLFEVYLSAKQMKKPLPACVQGIYDEEQYNRWVSYTHEKRRFSLISGAITTILMVAILAFDLLALVHSAAGSLLGASGYGADALMVVAFCLFFSVAEIIPNYIFTFRIEEKYGFNKSTKKTFWASGLGRLCQLAQRTRSRGKGTRYQNGRLSLRQRWFCQAADD